MSRPLRLYAHRGASAELPENTLESFARAIEYGANALEMDVHMSRDGEIVVSHDPTTLRTTGVDLEIRNSSWEELRALRTRKEMGGVYRMPLLREVLMEFRDIPINIDLKQQRPSIVQVAYELLEQNEWWRRVTVASFHTRNLIAMHRLGYKGPLGLSAPEVLAVFAGGARFVKGAAAQVMRNVGPLRLDSKRFIKNAHRHGIRCDYWTVNDPTEAKILYERGADGVMTDDPKRVGPVFRAHLAAIQ